MNKDQLISSLESFHDGLEKLRVRMKKIPTMHVNKAISNETKDSSTKWYEQFKVVLPRFGVSDDTMTKYSAHFDKLLELSLAVSRKSTYLKTLDSILGEFQNDLLVPVHKTAGSITSISDLEKILANATDDEKLYLDESLGCARHGFMRASVILGWCAAVYRMQKKIEMLGFDKFSQKSAEMANKPGRFKRYGKKSQASNLSEFRAMVSDADMLWVLEYWGLIDSHQHDRLSACYVMRINAAHPGEAPVTEPNLVSFYSDLRLMVFENPSFRL